MGSKVDKKKQFSLTMKWLRDNYCLCEGVCLPRNIVYDQYLAFCYNQNLKPTCKATFGKVIKTKFPQVTSKRLGARGQSKYHYHGMAIKETSSYYQILNPVVGLTRFSNCRSTQEANFSKIFSLSSRAGTLLPNFPEVIHFRIDTESDVNKISIFLTMYKTHCQCILETIIGGEFDETIVDVLIPKSMQEIPEKLFNEIRSLGDNWEGMIQSSLENLPLNLTSKKMDVAKVFAKIIKKNVTFVHLVQTVRPLLSDTQIVDTMIVDIDKIDLNRDHGLELLYSLDQETIVFWELKDQIRNTATVESLIEWLDLLFSSHVLGVEANTETFLNRARRFLLNWTFLGSRLNHILTLENAESFVPFHLLKMMLEEYIFLAIESQIEREKETQYKNNLKIHMKNPSNSNTFLHHPGSCFLANHHDRKGKLIKFFNNTNEDLLTPPMSPSESLPYGTINCTDSYASTGHMLLSSKPLSHFPRDFNLKNTNEHLNSSSQYNTYPYKTSIVTRTNDQVPTNEFPIYQTNNKIEFQICEFYNKTVW